MLLDLPNELIVEILKNCTTTLFVALTCQRIFYLTKHIQCDINELVYSLSQLRDLSRCIDHSQLINLQREIIKRDHLPHFAWSLTVRPAQFARDSPIYAEQAARSCSISILEWLYLNKFRFNWALFDSLLSLPNMRAILWLMTKPSIWSKLKQQTCRNPSLRILQFLAKNGFPLSSRNYSIAITNGDTKMFKWLVKQKIRLPRCSLKFAITWKRFDIVDQMLEMGLHMTPHCFEALLETGELSVIKRSFVCANAHTNKLNVAISYGNLDVIRYFISSNTMFNEFSLSTALENSHVELYHTLIRMGAAPSVETAIVAFSMKNFDILDSMPNLWKPMSKQFLALGMDIDHLRWLAKHFIDIKSINPIIFVLDDSYETLEFILEHNYFTPRDLLQITVRFGFADKIIWLLQKFPDLRLHNYAHVKCNLEQHKILHEYNPHKSEDYLVFAITAKQTDVVEWLISISCPYSERSVMLLIKHGEFSMAILLMKPEHFDQATAYAIKLGHLELADILINI